MAVPARAAVSAAKAAAAVLRASKWAWQEEVAEEPGAAAAVSVLACADAAVWVY